MTTATVTAIMLTLSIALSALLIVADMIIDWRHG